MPLNIYAASKKSNELMAYAYSSLYSLKTTGLRFFTVYGPWDRPDMALTKFTSKMSQGSQFGTKGQTQQRFTYIDDIVSAIKKIIDDKVSKKKFI